ncbi:MAG: hypothetical protein LBT40_07820 [Deltaproteobacteria bacterium]|jgi:hypothetical protein|nr:hypothetical protein [Deltaproteobacteria bacterium]
MKALTTTALAVMTVACAVALAGCGVSPIPSVAGTPYKKFSPCDGRNFTSISRLPGASFSRSTARSCVQSIDPYDLSAWVEAPIISYKERGLSTMILGCANLTPDAESCNYGGLPGHASTLEMEYNFGTYPAFATVQKAVLAFYVEDNAQFFVNNAQIRGKFSVGDQLQSLGAPRHGPPGSAGWITVEITDFVARAISEQRIGALFTISLPCGRNESELTTVRVLKTPPVVVVEYR